MAGDQAMNFFDNDSELGFKEAMEVIKKYFATELSNFRFLREYNNPTGYWGVFFSDDKTTIFLGSERTFIDFGLSIDNEQIYLPDFEKRLLQLKSTSEKNFLFILDTIKRYLNSKSN